MSGDPGQFGALVDVLDLIRSGQARNRPALGRYTGLGRTVITQRVEQLLDRGLIEEVLPASGGIGRPPRELRLRAEAGHLLVAELGATSLSVGVADLAGDMHLTHEEPADVAAGPEMVLGRLEQHFDKFLTEREKSAPPIWGVGIGVPGPVEYATGRPVAPPIMPGWDGYPLRDRLSARYDVPTWVDNEVNLMALGELRGGLAQGERDMIFVKIGTGIGAGLVSAGQLHRGAQGSAGDVGHVAVEGSSVVCRCGNTGCLEALAGGAALGWQATEDAINGRSKFLATRLERNGAVAAEDIADAAAHGDPYSIERLDEAGHLVGKMLATMVNFYNPSLVVIGGGVARAGDRLLAVIRQSIYRRSLPLATRELRITTTSLADVVGLHGAAFMAIDELFSQHRLARWIDHGSPAGFPELAEDTPRRGEAAAACSTGHRDRRFCCP